MVVVVDVRMMVDVVHMNVGHIPPVVDAAGCRCGANIGAEVEVGDVAAGKRWTVANMWCTLLEKKRLTSRPGDSCYIH